MSASKTVLLLAKYKRYYNGMTVLLATIHLNIINTTVEDAEELFKNKIVIEFEEDN